MHPFFKLTFTLLLLCSFLGTCVRAQKPNTEWTEVSVDLPVVGQIAPRKTKEIAASHWSVGGETMDRDYTIYANWKGYVEDLGIKKVRLQSGWAKTEKIKGEYDFAWLDEHVYGLREQGVDPWISISYGNPLYRGGGGMRLGAKLPTSGAAYAAWQNYTRALVTRYRDVVDTWEVWNEPNSHNPPEAYGKLLIATGKIIRELQPGATIIGFATAGTKPEWSAKTLTYLRENDGIQYLDLLCYHPYRYNPDEVYTAVVRLRDTLKKYAPEAELYQGENGAPSEYRETKALKKHPWTELTQAKWFLRRALGDYGRGIHSNLFSIVDLKYPDEINRKGLLLIDDAKEVIRPKHAYYAVQHLASIFDASVVPDNKLEIKVEAWPSFSAFGFRKSGGNAPIVALWADDNVPSDANATLRTSVHVGGAKFSDPVLVDLRTGVVYAIPGIQREKTADGHVFHGIPLYDSPVLLAERSALPLKRK